MIQNRYYLRDCSEARPLSERCRVSSAEAVSGIQEEKRAYRNSAAASNGPGSVAAQHRGGSRRGFGALHVQRTHWVIALTALRWAHGVELLSLCRATDLGPLGLCV